MAKLSGIKYSASAFNISMVIVRLAFGLTMMTDGYSLFDNYGSMKNHFTNFFHLGSTVSVTLAIIIELACGFLIIAGMFTRYAAISVLVYFLLLIFFSTGMGFSLLHGGKNVISLSLALLLLLCGPGKISMDSLMK